MFRRRRKTKIYRVNQKCMRLDIVDSTHDIFFSFSNEEPDPVHPCFRDYFLLFLSFTVQYCRSCEPDSRLHLTSSPSWVLSTVTGATVTKSKRSVRTTPSLYWTVKKILVKVPIANQADYAPRFFLRVSCSDTKKTHIKPFLTNPFWTF